MMPPRPRAPSRTRGPWIWRGIQLTALLAGAWLILTSGPRSVHGHVAPELPANGEADVGLTPDTPGSGPTSAADPTEVDWRMLAGLDLKTGEMTPTLRRVVGTEVKVPGFMVPLEDDLEQVSEFLLVPYVGACVHTPPPPPNQLVHVTMAEGRSVPVEWWDPIWVHGVLTVDETRNVYSKVSYTLTAVRTSPYRW